jgi:hypothetical protein
MGSTRDLRRVGAASVTVSAGAVMFFAVGGGPASAATRATAQTASECKLGPILCGLLGGGSGTPTASPTSGGGSGKPTTKPATKPEPKPQPKPRADPRPRPASRHSSHSGSRSGLAPGGGSGSVRRPVAPRAAGGHVPQIAAPQQQGPALPDITARDPLVYPQEAPAGREQPTPARLVAAGDPIGEPVPPLLVATASGLIGAVTALNLSVLGRRLRRPGPR